MRARVEICKVVRGLIQAGKRAKWRKARNDCALIAR
jgi:hypothetical protein